jgi:hypothetical protein
VAFRVQLVYPPFAALRLPSAMGDPVWDVVPNWLKSLDTRFVLDAGVVV